MEITENPYWRDLSIRDIRGLIQYFRANPCFIRGRYFCEFL